MQLLVIGGKEDVKKLSKDQELKLLAQLSERELLMEMRTSFNGLSKEDAAERLEEYGPNQVDAQNQHLLG